MRVAEFIDFGRVGVFGVLVVEGGWVGVFTATGHFDGWWGGVVGVGGVYFVCGSGLW